MRNKYIALLLLLILNIGWLEAQELNMRITINSDKLGGTDKTTFTSLQDALNQLVNGRKWTNVNFRTGEKIECSMLITINEHNNDAYKAEIQVMSNRPVYNSSYTTPLLNFKDSEFEFEYQMGQNIEFSDNSIDNNLTATIAFYAYIILGLDFDSFSLSGGKPYFDKAMNIATSAQGLGGKGWTPFGGDRNRYALALSLTEESTASTFHTIWYNYHRKGLDEMAANVTRGRTEIENTIPSLQKIYQARSASPILLFYADTKLDEVVNIYAQASSEEKQAAYKILQSIYPTRTFILERMKK